MRRCLIVANQTLTGPALMRAVVDRQVREPCDFHIVVPATHQHGTAAWTEGGALAHARSTLQHALEQFGDAGIPATGEVGDASPMLAVGDVLRREHIDEIILSTLPPGASKWLKRDLPHRLARYHLPVTHIVADPVPVA
ncbi:MAG TPA: hypothetical protein VFX21_04570 [Acidimicrobiia bacterium]|jgi:hypothetical protein|nr:hypothetical protein [Acidimicrobiia bacterium]